MTNQNRRPYFQAWAARNAEHRRAYRKAWKTRNAEKVQASKRQWRKKRANELRTLKWRNSDDLQLIAMHLCITPQGQVFRRDTGEQVPMLQYNGYPYVSLHQYIPRHRGIAFVHRLVLALHGPKQPQGKPFVLHNNGVKTDCRLENLRWGNAQDNADDARNHGVRVGRPRGPRRSTPSAGQLPLTLD